MMATDTVLRTDDIETVLEHADTREEELLVCLGFETGARLRELLAICGTDIVLGGELAVLILAPNTRTERTLPLVRSRPHLQAWLDEHPGRERPLFLPEEQCTDPDSRYTTVQARLRELGRKAGIEPLYAHRLRRAARHRFLTHGISPPTVEWALGWQAPTAPVDDRDALGMFLELLENRL